MSIFGQIAALAGFEPIRKTDEAQNLAPAPSIESTVTASDAGGVQNSAQIPITEFTRGSDAWNELFGPYNQVGLPAPTRHTAMASTAIHACVSLLSGAIMAMPVHIYRVNLADGERDRIYTDDLIWVLNEEMSPRWAASAGWEYLVCSLLFEGDAFAIIKRDRMSRPIGLEPVHPLRVQVFPYSDGSRLVYDIAPEFYNGRTLGERQVLDQDDVLHVPGFGFDGFRGMSPLRYSLRQAGALALATQEYAANFFGNSARPDYALSTEQTLGASQIKEMQDLIDERHRSTANSHRPMLLHGGLKIQPWSISASDMQLLATRQFQVEEVARAYGVPPFMIGHTEKTTSFGTGVESMGKGFVRYGLRRHLHKFEVEVNRKLFRTAARVAEFDTSDLERADTKTLMDALRVGVGRAGEPQIIKVNEARAILRLKKEKSGETLGINPGGASTSQGDQSQQQEPSHDEPPAS